MSHYSYKNSPILIGMSLIATVYAYLWDILMDWGISLRYIRRVIFCECDKLPHNRIFSPHVYITCAILDLFGRLTWVATLIPIHVISDDIVQRELILTLISSIEIARRCMWSVLRMEYEQVSNASGFRAAIWVPPKLGPSRPK